MPTVGGREFDYTPQGISRAKAYARATGQQVEMKNKKQLPTMPQGDSLSAPLPYMKGGKAKGSAVLPMPYRKGGKAVSIQDDMGTGVERTMVGGKTSPSYGKGGRVGSKSGSTRKGRK